MLQDVASRTSFSVWKRPNAKHNLGYVYIYVYVHVYVYVYVYVYIYIYMYMYMYICIYNMCVYVIMSTTYHTNK